MTRNIYDDEGFFAGYSRLPRSREGLDAAPEWPSLRVLLPDLAGARVLDLGCGFGWFCRWAREHGAARVLGLDLSERMLARAQAETQDPAISYERADLEEVALLREAFDLVYSSLALHYVADLARLLAEVAAALVPGGAFVASLEHPIFTAPSAPGWTVDGDGRRVWGVDRYLDEGPRTTDWLAPGVVKQHRTIGTYLNLMIGAGLDLSHVEEWAPSADEIATHPDWAGERERPPFLILAGTRRRS